MKLGRLRKSEVGQSPREQLIHNLDSVRAPVDVHQISEMCLRTVKSHDAAVEILLEWISTPYREGQEHVYLTVRLLRNWNRLGYDTDKAILSHLASNRSITGLRKQNLYQLVAELIRSRQFSVGRYCHWLLARGALSGRDGLHKVRASWSHMLDVAGSPIQNDPCDVRLLAELPLQGLPHHTANLRSMLLSGASFSIIEESKLIEDVEDMIRSQCADLFDLDIQGDLNSDQAKHIELSSLSWTVKSEISRWLRQVVVSRVQKGDP